MESTQDAEKYLKTIKRTLYYLYGVSLEAGMNSHAGFFMGICAAFSSSSDDLQEVVELINQHTKEKVDLYAKENYA